MTAAGGQDAWIDLLESDLGQAAVLRLLVNAGGQKRAIPKRAAGSKLAGEVGLDTVEWLAARFAGTLLDIPSKRGRARQDNASLLRAAILEAGLIEPSRSANDIATEFGVTTVWVHTLRARIRAEHGTHSEQLQLPLFPERRRL
ncbi:hypothetical protein Q9299_05240 [Gemmobacter fulvus]|uniref:hypothetical protein n=1 Tax=Gemmobacter fulvus TaxID=2840474 RepID=UPI002796BD99|nr:hypothetical protein [Gemmobacter fulvus]MDQ1847687.1 hypothetical protein [Gemmobacter fulvus]